MNIYFLPPTVISNIAREPSNATHVEQIISIALNIDKIQMEGFPFSALPAETARYSQFNALCPKPR